MLTQLQWIINALLALVPGSIGVRIVFHLIRLSTDPDQATQYKTRIKNCLMFVVIAETCVAFLKIIYYYMI